MPLGHSEGPAPTRFVKSANGVEVQRQRIRTSANLADGDHIRIGDHEFTFEIGRH